MLEPSDITSDSESDALRVIAYAASIAPCVDALPKDGPLRERAIAILSGVMKQIRARGTTGVKAQRVGTASVDYDVGSFFSVDDRSALAAICRELTGSGTDATSRGSFPRRGSFSRVWPEEVY